MNTLLDDFLDRITASIFDIGPCVTDFNPESIKGQLLEIDGEDHITLSNIGISIRGRTDCKVLVASKTNKLRKVLIENFGSNNIFFFGNFSNRGEFNVVLRTQGSECLVSFPDAGRFPVQIPNLFLRSNKQLFFWGLGSTSVSTKIELEGVGKKIFVGDDCMMSSGVWIRNHDMHCIFDIESNTMLNKEKADVIIEQHVWLGFEAFLLSSERIGFGSIIGARSLVKDRIEREVLAVGTPAKIVRRGVGWCRSSEEIQPGVVRKLLALRNQ